MVGGLLRALQDEPAYTELTSHEPWSPWRRHTFLAEDSGHHSCCPLRAEEKASSLRRMSWKSQAWGSPGKRGTPLVIRHCSHQS